MMVEMHRAEKIRKCDREPEHVLKGTLRERVSHLGKISHDIVHIRAGQLDVLKHSDKDILMRFGVPVLNGTVSRHFEGY